MGPYPISNHFDSFYGNETMVSEVVGSRSHRGLRDWLAQRVTALIIGFYSIFVLAYILIEHPLDYVQWYAFFNHPFLRICTFLVFLSVVWHAWIGLWTVFTDYIKSRPVRMFLEGLVLILLVTYLGWGLEILWAM